MVQGPECVCRVKKGAKKVNIEVGLQKEKKRERRKSRYLVRIGMRRTSRGSKEETRGKGKGGYNRGKKNQKR